MDHGGVDRGPCLLLNIHNVCHIHCLCNSVHLVTWHLLFIWSHNIYCSSGHMTYIVHLVTWHIVFCPSWRGILLCCSPEGFLPFFYPERDLGSFSWSDEVPGVTVPQPVYLSVSCTQQVIGGVESALTDTRTTRLVVKQLGRSGSELGCIGVLRQTVKSLLLHRAG